MRTIKVFFLALLVGSAGTLLSSCAHLDTTPPAAADRVLTGTVICRSVNDLPPRAEVTVRVVDLSMSANRADVLGEQTIADARSFPVHFRIEYHAEDSLLMRSVAVEARVSVGGRLRYVTKSAHPLTMSNVNDPHVIEVELAGKP